MKLAHRSALLCLISASLPLFVACGSNDGSNLFSGAGGSSSSTGGDTVGSGGSVAHAGQGAGGHMAGKGGSSGGTSVAGQGTGGSGTSGSNGIAGTDAGGTGGTDVGGMSAGGMSGGGASGSGGNNAGGAGTGGASAGSGGASAGTGGMNGGSGGAGGAACPMDAPQGGTACSVQTPDSCFYSGEVCSCLPDGVSASGHKWSCYGTPDKCPALSPTDGTSCKTFGGGLCPYSATDYCVCVPAIAGGGGDPKWSCADAGAFCPNTRPAKGTLCSPVKECAYAERECFCNGANWTCE